MYIVLLLFVEGHFHGLQSVGHKIDRCELAEIFFQPNRHIPQKFVVYNFAVLGQNPVAIRLSIKRISNVTAPIVVLFLHYTK